MHLGHSLAPFYALLGPFWVIWAPFWALLAPFRINFWTLLVPLGAENHPATHFYRFSKVFDELGDVLVDFVDTILKNTHTTAPQTHIHKT